jgi:hypothetical protein
VAKVQSKSRQVRRRSGDVVAIPLNDGTFGFGRVLREPLVAFYDLRSEQILPIDAVICAPVAFVIWVMNRAITHGTWPVIGHAPLSPDLCAERAFFKKDAISGALTIYRDATSDEIPATREECEDLECAAVWEPHHVVDRLRDHFEGRPNSWFESMRP